MIARHRVQVSTTSTCRACGTPERLPARAEQQDLFDHRCREMKEGGGLHLLVSVRMNWNTCLSRPAQCTTLLAICEHQPVTLPHFCSLQRAQTYYQGHTNLHPVPGPAASSGAQLSCEANPLHDTLVIPCTVHYDQPSCSELTHTPQQHSPHTSTTLHVAHLSGMPDQTPLRRPNPFHH